VYPQRNRGGQHGGGPGEREGSGQIKDKPHVGSKTPQGGKKTKRDAGGGGGQLSAQHGGEMNETKPTHRKFAKETGAV